MAQKNWWEADAPVDAPSIDALTGYKPQVPAKFWGADIEVDSAPPPDDRWRLTKAFAQGDANAITSTTDFVSDIESAMEKGVIGRTFASARDALGIENSPPPKPEDRPNAKIYDNAKLELAKLEAQGFAVTKWDDVDGISSFVRFLGETTSASLPQMATAIASGGFSIVTQTAMLGAQANDELKQKTDLSEAERVSVAATAGVLMWSLETIGLGVMLRGVLPGTIATQAAAGTLGKFLTGRGFSNSGARIIEAAFFEGGTELLQEGVVISAVAASGGKFTEGEIRSRLKESFIAGAGMGGTIRTGVEPFARTFTPPPGPAPDPANPGPAPDPANPGPTPGPTPGPALLPSAPSVLEASRWLLPRGDAMEDILDMSPSERAAEVAEAQDSVTPIELSEAQKALTDAGFDMSLPDSTRLTAGDRASPIANDLIEAGKAEVADLLAAPTAADAPAVIPLPGPTPVVAPVVADAPAAIPMPEPDAAAAPAPVVEVDPGAQASDTVMIDPATIEADPKRFQFKDGGDKAGVTGALAGDFQWNSDYSGISVVWEDNSGRRFIVDGHQRLDLAQRAKAGGQDGVAIRAKVLREADGVTAEAAMMAGAMKNLAEGGETTKARDVARVFRMGGAEEAAQFIPPKRVAYRDGAALAKLSEDAWGLVVNEKLPDAHGAEIGRLVADKDMHAAVASALIDAKPRNSNEARLLVGEILNAGFTQETQGGLFGDEVFTDTLIRERARILDNTMKMLRATKAAFKTVIREQDMLSSAGNVLDAGANTTSLSANERLSLTLEKLAQRKGPISDALNEAARGLKAGTLTAGAARKQFLAAIEPGAAVQPDPVGPRAGGSAADLLSEQGAASAAGSQDQSVAPNRPGGTDVTTAGNQSVIPGAEQASDADMAAQGAAAPMKPKAPQQAADDGLFDTGAINQTDMFGTPPAAPQPVAADPAKQWDAMSPVQRTEVATAAGLGAAGFNSRRKWLGIPVADRAALIAQMPAAAPVDAPAAPTATPAAPNAAAAPASAPVAAPAPTSAPVADAAPNAAPAPAQRPAVSQNKLVSDARAEEIRAKLKAKLRDQLNAGIDPELLTLGAELAVYHIERGARTFTAFTKAVSDDLGVSVAKLRPYLRSWYNGARDMTEDMGGDVAGMDSSDTVRSELAKMDAAPAESAAPAPKPAATIDGTGNAAIDAFATALRSGEKFDIRKARAMEAEASGIEADPTNALRDKAVEEHMEAAVAIVAREIVANGANPATTYRALVDLYGRQPLLISRTSTSIANQAYSTPAPLAYLASRAAGIDGTVTVYEPSAGNGMLLMEAAPENVTANEIDPTRAARLKMVVGEGATVTTNDGANNQPAAPVDVVIANPPFGKVANGGKNTRWTKQGITVQEVDHAISFEALAAMKDNGRAVLIIGGKQEVGADARKKAYQSEASSKFFKTLYDTYNVVDHYTADGNLYARQGAGWPVDVIVIEGRKATPEQSGRAYPMREAPLVLSSWEQLGSKLNARVDTAEQLGNAGVNPAPVAPAASPDAGNVSRPAGRPDRPAGVGGGTRSGAATAASDGGNGRPDGPRGSVDGGRPDGGSEQLAPGPRGDAVRPGASSAPDAQPGGRPGAGVRDAGGISDGAVSDPELTAAPKRKANAEKETEHQVKYAPKSTSAFAVGTVAPRNMVDAMARSLEALEAEVGPIDAYVADKLGYEIEEVTGGTGRAGYFSAEQVDAIALAISNVENDAGFIIGDQTGVGKGRVVAAMIRYALNNGRVPVFVTKSPGLYGDMIRDMRDIGYDKGHKARVLITNGDLRGDKVVPLDPNNPSDTLSSQSPSQLKAAIRSMAQGKGMPDGFDVLFTTYSQMQKVAGKTPERQDALMAIAPRAMVIMDESHEAGGGEGRMVDKEGNVIETRADFARKFLGAARGAIFSSATYAKNPTVMSLYFTTDLSLAVDKIDDLAGVIAAGGVPFQQVIANMLVESGQYVRRERSFDGVEIAMAELEVDSVAGEKGAEALRNIFRLDSDYLEGAREAWVEAAAENGTIGAADGGVGESSASSVGFSSVMHNVISQMLLSIKAPAVVEQAIALHRAGEKPVLALANTNGSIIEDYIRDNNLTTGSAADLTFNAILDRYLKRLRRITVKDAEGNKSHVMLTDAELDTYGPPGALAEYRKIEKAIADIDLSGLPASPIDYIIDRMGEAGIRVGEITGRGKTLGGGKVTLRDNSAAAKKQAMFMFNDGRLDALVVNQSGATGFSLHPTANADNDGKPRHMIVLQPEPNIDTFMQMLGRIFRTGQIHLPRYTIAVSNLAVEKRVAAVLMRKMASLNANTTASKKSAVSLDAVDFMNKYGDEVVRDYLRENPEVGKMLGVHAGADIAGLAAKFTGKLAIMPPAEVTAIYEELEGAYNQYIESLDRMGMNALEAKTLDLQAETQSSVELVKAKGGESPFSQAANIETVSAAVLRKPYEWSEVEGMVEKSLEGMPSEDFAGAQVETLRGKMPAYIAKMEASLARVDGELLLAKTEKQTERLQGSRDSWKARISEAEEAMDNMATRVFELRPGQAVELQFKDGETEVIVQAVSLGAEIKGVRENPTAPSAVSVRFAVADGAREVSIPMSKISGEAPPYSYTPVRNSGVKAAFDNGESTSRETRQIITGNLVAGFAAFKKGQIIMFTDDKGKTKQGILMPKDFNAAREMAGMAAKFTEAKHIAEFLSGATFDSPRMVKSSDGIMAITNDVDAGMFAVTVKTQGGKPYFTLKAATAIVGDFSRRGKSGMGVKGVSKQQIARLVKAYQENLGTDFETDAHKAEARTITGETVIEDAETVTRERRAPAAAGPASAADLRARLDALGLNTTGLEVDSDNRSGGLYIKRANGTDQIVVGSDAAAEMTLDHEAMHALYQRGLFTPAEWSVLSKRAEALWIKKHNIKALYPEGDAELWIEEAIAEEFAVWAAGKRTSTPGAISRLFEKIRAVVEAIQNWARGDGLQSAAGVMDRADRGEVGARGAQPRDASGQFVEREQAAYHGSPHRFDKFTTGRMGTGEGVQAFGWGMYFAGKRGLAEHYRKTLSRTKGSNKNETATVYGVASISPERAVDIFKEKMIASGVEDSTGTISAYNSTMRSPSAKRFLTIKKVASTYADMATDWSKTALERHNKFKGSSLDSFANDLLRQSKDMEALAKLHRDFGDSIRSIDYGQAEAGALYTVEIPEDAELLTYDDPINEQPPQVVAALTDLMDGKKPTGTGMDAYKSLSRKLGGDQAASLALAEAGVPGHRFLDGNSRRKGEGSYNYVIYADDSVSVVTRERRRNVPPGPFDTFEHRTSRELSRMLRPSNWGQIRSSGGLAELFTAAGRKISDVRVDLRRQQDAIEDASGAKIPPGQDTYEIASLYVGKAGARLQNLYDGHVKPIVKALDDAGIKSTEMDDYLTAKHAAEANAHIAKLYAIENPGHQFVEAMTNPNVIGGSGMSAFQASRIIGAAENGPKAAQFKAVAGMVRRMLDQALDLQVSSGLTSQDSADAMRATYKNYVPLRGYMDEEADGGSGVGRGFDVRGQESKARMGRGSRSDSPLAYAFTHAATTVIRSEKNRVAKTFLRMVEANPNPNAWEVNRREIKKVMGKSSLVIIDPATGDPIIISGAQIKTKSIPPSRMSDNVLIVKVAGKEIAITIYNKDIAAGLKNLNPENAGMLTRAVGAVTRLMASLNTSRNPEWFVPNIFRDIGTAGIQISNADKKGITAKMLKNIPMASVGAAQYFSGKGSSPWRQVAENFVMDGGKVSYIDFKGVEEFKDMISNRSPEAGLKKMWMAGPARALDAIEVVTSTGENALRIAAYKAALDLGLSRQQAASIGRQVTVDFNKKGTASPVINAWYMFFNAAVQGSTAVVKTVSTNKNARLAAAGLVSIGILEGMLGGGDDDEYKLIAPYVRERNIIIMKEPLGLGASGTYFKIPIPYGYNAFKVMGTEASRVAFHGISAGEAAMTTVAAVLNSFNPLGSFNFITAALPTVADPIADTIMNRTFTGSTVKPEFTGDKRPPSEQYYPNVSSWSKAATAWANDATGGNAFHAGAISISPEQIDHILQAYTGGVGRLIGRSGGTIGRMIEGKPIDVDNTPFLRSVYGDTMGEIPSWMAYSKISKEAEALAFEIKGLRKAGRGAEAAVAAKRDPALTQMIGPFKIHAKLLTDIREAEAKIRGGPMSEDAKDARLDQLRQRQYEIQRRALAQYFRVRAAAE